MLKCLIAVLAGKAPSDLDSIKNQTLTHTLSLAACQVGQDNTGGQGMGLFGTMGEKQPRRLLLSGKSL